MLKSWSRCRFSNQRVILTELGPLSLLFLECLAHRGPSLAGCGPHTHSAGSGKALTLYPVFIITLDIRNTEEAV